MNFNLDTAVSDAVAEYLIEAQYWRPAPGQDAIERLRALHRQGAPLSTLADAIGRVTRTVEDMRRIRSTQRKPRVLH